jgi:hypothetical protein
LREQASTVNDATQVHLYTLQTKRDAVPLTFLFYIIENFVRHAGNYERSNGLPKTKNVVRHQTYREIYGPMDVVKPCQELRHIHRRRKTFFSSSCSTSSSCRFCSHLAFLRFTSLCVARRSRLQSIVAILTARTKYGPTARGRK